jgi:hypothetical protein
LITTGNKRALFTGHPFRPSELATHEQGHSHVVESDGRGRARARRREEIVVCLVHEVSGEPQLLLRRRFPVHSGSCDRESRALPIIAACNVRGSLESRQAQAVSVASRRGRDLSVAMQARQALRQEERAGGLPKKGQRWGACVLFVYTTNEKIISRLAISNSAHIVAGRGTAWAFYSRLFVCVCNEDCQGAAQ